MSFRDFFAVYNALQPLDPDEYARDVEEGRALAAELERRTRGLTNDVADENVRRAIVQAELVAAISDPLNALKHFANYLALNSDFWAAGKLNATYMVARSRKEKARKARRKAAQQTNAGTRAARAQWLAVVLRLGERIRRTRSGARLSNSALAQRIAASREFRSLATQPHWRTVSQELPGLNLGKVVWDNSPKSTTRDLSPGAKPRKQSKRRR